MRKYYLLKAYLKEIVIPESIIAMITYWIISTIDLVIFGNFLLKELMNRMLREYGNEQVMLSYDSLQN